MTSTTRTPIGPEVTPRPALDVRALIHVALIHVALILGSFVMLLPFGWMLVTSLKSPPQIFTYPPSLVPNPVVWQNYVDTMQAMPFGRFYLNSIFVAFSVTTLQILTSSLSAFAFARLRFRGREILFLVYLATLMIPFQVTMIPNFILVSYLHWYDTFYALIVPTAFSAFAVFLLRQYFRGIPVDLDEAARMDGASSLRIWGQVIMPLSSPVLAALTIFVFLGSWNDFLWPLVVTNSNATRTIPVGLASFRGQFNTDWHLLMAGSVIALLPVLLVYVIAQKRFIEGITLSGMGGR